MMEKTLETSCYHAPVHTTHATPCTYLRRTRFRFFPLICVVSFSYTHTSRLEGARRRLNRAGGVVLQQTKHCWLLTLVLNGRTPSKLGNLFLSVFAVVCVAELEALRYTSSSRGSSLRDLPDVNIPVRCPICFYLTYHPRRSDIRSMHMITNLLSQKYLSCTHPERDHTPTCHTRAYRRSKRPI